MKLDAAYRIASKELPDIEDKFLSKARERIIYFTVYTKNDYEIEWFHRKIAKKLEDFISGEIKRLMIFMPPRHGKSELVSRRLPAFIFGKQPDSRIISTSYGASLASKMSRDVQKIIESESYQQVFPHISLGNFKEGDKNKQVKRTQLEFEIGGFSGSYLGAGIGGGITGAGGDYLLIDDPIKNQEEALSEVYRENIWEWYSTTAYTRLERDGKVLIVLTRWHDDDLAGRLLVREPGVWDVLSFDALKEHNYPGDERKELGQALWPSKYSKKELEATKSLIGSRNWSSLYQQNPTPSDGGLFKSNWWKYFQEEPLGVEAVAQFWDCAHKVGIDNDYSVCSTWAKTRSGLYVLNVFRKKMEAPELEAMCQAQFNKYRPSAVVIEDKASGIGLIQNLRRKTTMPIIPWNPGQRDKQARASAATPTVEAGNVYLNQDADWLDDFIKEHERFPLGQHDDIVDTTSMAIEYFAKYDITNPRIRTL